MFEGIHVKWSMKNN